jgi:hypothetical protein
MQGDLKESLAADWRTMKLCILSKLVLTYGITSISYTNRRLINRRFTYEKIEYFIIEWALCIRLDAILILNNIVYAFHLI